MDGTRKFMGLDIKGQVVTGYWCPQYGETRMQNEFNFRIVQIRKGSLREITEGIEPKKAEPKKAEPKKAEPKKAEPKKAEPKKAEKKSEDGEEAYHDFLKNMKDKGD